jgi:hypothetical protein
MIEPITINVTYSADDYARGSLFMARRSWWIRYLYIVVLAFIWALYGIGLLFAGDGGRETLQKNLVVFVIASILLIIFGVVSSRRKTTSALRRRFQKQIDSSPALQESRVLTFDEKGLSAQQSLGSGDISWDAVIEVVETPDDFFFFTASKFAQFIPKTAFSHVNDEQRLRDFLRDRFGSKATLLQ